VADHPPTPRPIEPTHTEERRELSVWQGPLPPPAVLQGYKDLLPDGPDRVFKQWERETEHRQSLERRRQSLPFWDRALARGTALVFAFGCLAVIAYVASIGAEWAAVALSGAMIVAGINAFIRRS
jgi:uncharacterized membrane protein